ncbi:flagellar FlbD family protein [Desemzia sp. RIT804]|uniref:flagellar FlbD family protein n=1 Tax=Desemzia sp. RIT 804 TaxID=2810209 RepID=UPI0019518CD4|nr:flagellar FlbD family protein [Desemzia sp. RIT 804]MBM6614691.1 flagellar FlbD family protein [Desemzia sp. RIT 804]
MIALTSVSGKEFYLNCDLIYRMEHTFDTIITLVDGKTIRVVNSEEDIIKKIIVYKRKIYTQLPESGGEE